MNKLGIAVWDLGPSQLSYLLITSANRLLASRSDLDVMVFYEALQRPPTPPNFSVLQICEGWCYNGPVVATTFNTAEKLLRFPSCPRRFFYVWNLEWLRWKTRSYARLRQVYGSPDITLLARCEEHADILSKLWNRPVQSVGEFDVARLAETVLS
jgi:hypothetical protein